MPMLKTLWRGVTIKAICLVPLYFREDFLPDIKQDAPIAGWLWLTGQIEEDETETTKQ
ncbi:MAG: hypothetical protein LUC91_11285 [Prevotella sp.]|nr:hypothetical protein [Prevotella sp.]